MLPWQNFIWRSMNIMNVQFGCSQESFLSITVIYRFAYSFKTCKEMPSKLWSLQRNHSSNLMYLMRLKSGIHEQVLKDFIVYMETYSRSWPKPLQWIVFINRSVHLELIIWKLILLRCERIYYAEELTETWNEWQIGNIRTDTKILNLTKVLDLNDCLNKKSSWKILNENYKRKRNKNTSF